MIKVDYLIERQEGDRTAKYGPTVIPTELPNVVYIQGPNSSGKSTLLNMIALAFFGRSLSDDELNPHLRERLDNLVDSNHQKIQFKIEVENEILGVKLVSHKIQLDSAEIVLKDFQTGKGFPISPEAFKREYKLIYDIPNNPLERLPLLLRTVRNDQKDIGEELERLRNQLRKIIDEIKDSRDPDLLEKLHEKCKLDQDTYDRKKKIAEEELQKHQKLVQYFRTRFYLQYQKEQNEIKYSINKITKHLGKRKQRHTKEHKHKLILHDQLENLINDADRLMSSIKSILPNLLPKKHMWSYKLWAEATFRDEVIYDDIYDTLRKESRSLSEYLWDTSLTEKQKYQNEIANISLLRTLITTLEGYRNHKITIPVVNLSIEDFIESLRTDLEKYGKLIIKLENIEKCANELAHLVRLVNDGIALAKELKSLQKKSGVADDEEVSRQLELESLESRITGIAEKANDYRTAIIKEGLDPEESSSKYFELKSDPEIKLYEIYTEPQLEKKLEDSWSTCESLREECQLLEKSLEGTNREIQRFEEKKPHKYQEKYPTVHQILKHVLNLEKHLHLFDGALKKMTANSKKQSELSADDKRYSNAVGEYLAKKIGTLRHISNVYEVRNIDVISKVITTDTGTVIHFSDLGTGQGQAAYLDTLLSMSANKKIIALFDEIAMMDDVTLKPIKEKLKRLYDEKKLLMAVIVQKGEQVEVEPII
jgi:DNA repair protein SbcC/Rad50